MEVGSQAPIQAQMFVMDKAKEVQENAIMKVIDSASAQSQNLSSAVTGVGKNLDISA